MRVYRNVTIFIHISISRRLTRHKGKEVESLCPVCRLLISGLYPRVCKTHTQGAGSREFQVATVKEELAGEGSGARGLSAHLWGSA